MGALADSADSDVMSTTPMLSTVRNLVILSFYNFASTFCAAGNIMFLWYFGGFGLSYVYLNLVGLISTVFTTFVQIAVGYYGDKLNTRFGRRKPLVVAGNILSVLCTFILAFPPSTDQNSMFGWTVIFATLLYSSFIISGNPYGSWLIESTNGPDDYRRIATIASPLGTILGAIAGLAISDLFSHPLYCVINLVLLAVSTALLVTFIPNPQNREVEKQPDIIPSLRTCMRSKEFKVRPKLLFFHYRSFIYFYFYYIFILTIL